MTAKWQIIAPLSTEAPARSFLVDYRGRRCVLRRNWEEGLNLETFAAVRAFFALGGIPVQDVIACGEDYLLLGFVDGEPGGPWVGANVAPDRVAAAFETLARMHNLPLAEEQLALETDAWGDYLSGAFSEWSDLRSHLAGCVASLSSDRRVLCHGDFHPANVIYRGAAVAALLDFEYAHRAFPEYDLAYALLTFCGDWPRAALHKDAIRIALQAYAFIRPPDPVRLRIMLPVATLALRAWCAALPAADRRRSGLLSHLDGLLQVAFWEQPIFA